MPDGRHGGGLHRGQPGRGAGRQRVGRQRGGRGHLGHGAGGSPRGAVGTGEADATLLGLQACAGAGWHLQAAGDLDGAGLADLLVGAPVADEARGAVWLLLGGQLDAGLEGAPRAWVGGVAGQQLGCDADAALDINGDGYADLWLGSDADERGLVGRGCGICGGPSLAASGVIDPDVELEGMAVDAPAGSSVIGADLDGDGVRDVAVNACDVVVEDAGGAACVNHGPLTGYRSLGESDASFRGRTGDIHGTEAVGVAGDMDRDGQGELVFGGHT